MPLALLAFAPLPAQFPGTNWVQLSPANSPPAQYARGMAYDSARDRVVLFGSNTGAALRDTWEFDGAGWNQLSPALSPPARTGHAMVYDSARRVCVLYGGKTPTNNSPLADTWEWNGSVWAQVMTNPTPPARDGHAMAYDTARQRVVLFGGYNGANLNDTWEWDGTNWMQRTSPSTPGVRRRAAMCYDSARARVVMLGGYNGNNYLSGTWEWDGANWLARTPSGRVPRARADLAMVFDSARSRSVLFGGYQGSIGMNDTWEWEDLISAEWMERSPGTVPPARSVHAMVYDSARRRVLLFGGTNGANVLGDIWVYTPDRPAAHGSFGSGCRGNGGTPVLRPDPTAPLPWVGYSFTTRVDNLGTNPAVVILGDSRASWNSIPLPLDLNFAGMPGCSLYTNPVLSIFLASAGGSTTLTIVLPNLRSLTRVPLYMQAIVPSLGSNAANLVTSDACEIVCGQK